MSHLLKNDLKKYFNLLKILVIATVLIQFSYGLLNYSGNYFVFISFSVIFNFLIYFGFRKNSIFFETFLSLLLWLGFWFKFSFIISFTDGLFREGAGNFNYSPNSFDEALIISQIGALAFIIGGYIREKFIFKYPKKITFRYKKNSLFTNHRSKIWIAFITLVLWVCVSNFYLKIYQKGLIPIKDFNFIFSGTYKWLLLFGLSSISALIIYNEAKNFKKFFLVSLFIAFCETFLSSMSMLSRGMIFNSFAILFGIYKFSNKINSPNHYSYYLKSLAVILVLFYISVSSVNYIRANYFYVGKSVEFVFDKSVIDKSKQNTKELKEKKYGTSKEINSEILYLIVNRWVGIDGVMSVSSKKDILSMPFLLSSFKERASKNTPTFYEVTFGLEENEISDELYENVKGNTLPGILAFSYYSGSYYILFFIVFLLTIISSYIEFISFKLSSNNLIFSSLIGQVIAFRFIHFGYLPHQTYLLFGSIILNIIFIYMLTLYSKKN